jgi:hypothetical protein
MWSVQNEDGGVYEFHTLRGTILPLMPAESSFNPEISQHMADDLLDHSTVQDWVIHLDGSVTLPSVAIVASKSITLTSSYPLDCQVLSHNPKSPNSRKVISQICLLEELLHSFPGEMHAICTMISDFAMRGILIHRLQSRGSFVKAGVFETASDSLLSSSEIVEFLDTPEVLSLEVVNWHFL